MLVNVPAQVSKVDNGIFQVDCDTILCPGQDLRQVQQINDSCTMAGMLHDFWKQRWNRDVVPPARHDWDRILSFAKAYVPPLPFVEAPLTLTHGI